MRKFGRPIFLAVALVLSSSAFGQAPSSEDRLKALDNRLKEIEKFRSEEFRELKTNLYAIATAIGALGAVIALFSVTSYFSGRKREQAVEKMINLVSSGEASSQKRAQELHDATWEKAARTLTLVNDTLELAKEATDANKQKRVEKVESKLESLDREAKGLLAEFFGQDDKGIVENAVHRDKLQRILDQLSDFDRLNSALEKELSLTPHLLFIRGMQYYVAHNFDAFERTMAEIVGEPKNDQDLLVRALFWQGWGKLVLGDFSQASVYFQRASNRVTETGGSTSQNASIERRIRLELLSIESRLFHFAELELPKALELVSEIEQIHSSLISDALRTKMKLVRGNIYYVSAMASMKINNLADAKKYMTLARNLWKDLYVETGNADAERDYVFSNLMLNEQVEDQLNSLEHIRENAVNTAGEIEDDPGHQASWRTVALICLKEMRKEPSVPAVLAVVIGKVEIVYYKSTIYSPIRKRYVTKKDFMDDLNYIKINGLPRLRLSSDGSENAAG